MATSHSIDGSRCIDWGQASTDYAIWRPDYPDEFYERLLSRGVGCPGQRILDLGTGVGFLATQFARQGANVTGVDVAAGQIKVARGRATQLGVDVEFRISPAEETRMPDATFEIVSASQCWMYFDPARIHDEVRRLLTPTGALLLAFFSYLPCEDATARATEELIQRHNCDWTGANWVGVTPDPAKWGFAEYTRLWEFAFDADIPFTRESWRGRIRACRGVGASMSTEEVARFDAEHAELLNRIVPPEFTVRHRIEAFLLRPPPAI